MTIQSKRQEYILAILQNSSTPLSITEIDNLIFEQNQFRCTRRTIARDLDKLAKDDYVQELKELNKSVYRINPGCKITLELTRDEVAEICRALESQSIDEELKEKFKKIKVG